MGLKLKDPNKATENAAVEEKKAAVAVSEKESAAVEASIPVAEKEDPNLEIYADKISLVCPLGDPSVDDVTDLKDGGKRTDPTIVGFKFVAEVDLDVPDCPPGEDFKTGGNLMSFTGDPLNTVKVKAGTPFMLTKFETGVLLSRPEFNGKVSGGEVPCTCVYQKTSKKSSSAQLAKTSSITALPSVSLRACSGSIKDIKMEEVLSFKVEKTENGKTRKVKTINPGYEKFANLTKVATRTKVRNGASTATVKRNAASAAFLQIISGKKA